MQRPASVPGPLLPRRGRPPRGGARIQSESWSGGPGSRAGAGPRLPGTAGTEDDARRCERGTTPRVPGRSPENDGEREGGRRGGQRERERGRDGERERKSEREIRPQGPNQPSIRRMALWLSTTRMALAGYCHGLSPGASGVRRRPPDSGPSAVRGRARLSGPEARQSRGQSRPRSQGSRSTQRCIEKGPAKKRFL